MSELPRKKLILVVHGVGQQVPGESVGLLTAALHEQPGTDTIAANLLIPEDRSPEDTGRINMFPCHTIRRRTAESDALFAEVYWADVATTSQRFIGIVFQLFQVILGLGHLVRESAEQAYKDHHFLRWLANMGVLILHGPIAAINCLVLLLCAVAMGFDLTGYSGIVKNPEDRFLWPFIFGAITILAGVILHHRTNRYLMCHFFQWLIVFSVIGIVLSWTWHVDEVTDTSVRLWETAPGAVQPLEDLSNDPPDPGGEFTSNNLKNYVEDEVCDWAGSQYEECATGLGGAFSVAAFFIHVEWMIWMVLLGGTCFLILLHFATRFRLFGNEPKPRPPALAPVALSAMMISWLFALSLIWAVTLFIYPEFGGHRALFLSSFFPVVVHWMMLLILMLEGAFLTGYAIRRYNHSMKKNGPQSYFDSNGQPKPPPRIILSDVLSVTIMIGPFLLILIMLLHARTGYNLALGSTPMGQALVSVSGLLLGKFMIVAVILGIGIYYFRDRVAVGLGIANDIINYKRLEQWSPHASDRVYPQRERIRGRFIRVAKDMIERHEPSEIIIVAHSQGTIIALDALRTDRTGAAAQRRVFDGEVREDRVWKLVTMGSPFSHLYGYYFPDFFKVPSKQDTYLSEWINIFRVDDPIGTHIGAKA
ncbi:MAG: hypothetical protein AAF503_02240, partial [Pseudomonadota bacterium]